MIATPAAPVDPSTQGWAPRPGSSERQGFLIKVNKHIQRFDGTICHDARNVQCGASETFRTNFCINNRPDCHDMNLFAPRDPFIRRRLNYEGSELIEDIRQDDLLLFWTYQIHGRPAQNPILCGLYVADGIDVDDSMVPPLYTMYPESGTALHIDWPLDAEPVLRRALGEHRWTKQLAENDLPWILNWLRDRVDERARQMRGRQSYDDQLAVLDRLIEEAGDPGVDTSAPMYAKFAGSGALALPLAPAPVVVRPPSLPIAPSAPAFAGGGPVARLQNMASSRQLHYPLPLLTRFHIAVATHPLVILSGRSGSGKTGLSRVYAEAETAVYSFVQVRPDWVSPSYLWGVYDYLAGCFTPTEFARRVREAGDEWNRARQLGRSAQAYIFCLDEMNLARIEHYFSDVLAAMEQPVGERWVELYSAALLDKQGFPSRLPITPNIRFIGTINVDETTHVLSPKVVDRSHFIRIDQVDLHELRTLLAGGYDPALLDFVFRHLEEIHRRMADDPSQQFGYRVARQILDWVKAATGAPYNLAPETALDGGISQKILPRLQIDPDNDSQMAMFDKLLAYFEQFDQATPGFDETLRWLRARHERLNLAEAVSGQQ